MGDVRPLTDSERAVESAVATKRRSENCMIDLQNVMKRWNCAINPMVTISARGIIPNFEIVPLEIVPGDLKGKGNNGPS